MFRPSLRCPWHGLRYTVLSALVLAGLAAPAPAEEEHQAAPHSTALTERDPAKLMDPMSILETPPNVWSVSRTDAGCYLMSPRRADSSSLAIGRHPKLGLGLFVVRFGLSVPEANAGEPVVIQAKNGDLNKLGRLAGVRLLFVPLDSSDFEGSLQGLAENGTLWLQVRRSWIAHGGQGIAEAVANYRQDCAGNGGAGR
jgi:hypothetical protein